MPIVNTVTAAHARHRRAVAFLAGVALVAGCGGGTSQHDPFTPQRIFAFGDETSVLTSDAPAGRNYGINGLKDTAGTTDDKSDDVFDCSVAPNWVQSLAASFGLVFPECNPKAVAEPQGTNRARAGARVDDVAAQVQAQVDAGGLRDRDLATVMVGTHDILDLYEQYTGPADEPALLEQARARGERTALIVNRLIDLGAKVVVANLPDLGLSPYALAEKEKPENQDVDRAALISRLVAAFNQQLGITILPDGRYVALVQIDVRTQAIGRSPGSFLIGNISDAACTTAPPDCTTNTLVDGAKTATYLWASDRWFAAAGQQQLATMAIDRAHRNPF